MKNWQLRVPPQSNPDPSWADALQISPMLLSMLWARGLTSKEDMDSFLSAKLSQLINPTYWPGIPEAASLLTQRLLDGSKLAVWGDYDVDGITATTLVLDVLECHGIKAIPHLPDRRYEGYGLNIPAIEAMAKTGVDTLLTVDCGISDAAPVARARELGMTVILSDHHLPPECLPEASAICNPRLQLNTSCPCPYLAGVGVAFFLMSAVNTLLYKERGTRCKMDEVLDLVALGTLADVMRLSGQNRILVKGGLRKLAEARRPGIAALKKVSNFGESAVLSSAQTVFRLAPRLNAAGRMGHADLGLRLLRAKERDEALQLAEELDAMNTTRRQEEERIEQAARAEALQQVAAGRAGLVLYGADWHAGIIGIVASRIVDEFYRPTIILCDDQQTIKGSGRSIPEFDLHAGLSSMSNLMLGFGGHKQAAGVRISPGGLDAFRTAFDTVVRNTLGNEPLLPTIIVEGELDFRHAGSHIFLNELQLLQPFGPGNNEPVFTSPRLQVTARLPLGRSGEHVILHLLDESTGHTLQAKAWRQATLLPESLCGQHIRVAYTPRLDTYNGVTSVDVHIKDWKLEN